MREVVELIVEYVGPSAGAPEFGALAPRALEQELEVDVDETARLLGWRATTDLEEGLRRTVEWFRREHERTARAYPFVVHADDLR